MQFQRLRLAGFKSFVEATEFRIEPGLTGIVGPNGCGKSNLLEALRWVMGATSAKAMRGEGMEDVIFGGAAGRPGRSHAEVSLQIDNADRSAPERFNDAAVIEVVRRIERGGGSSYRVNGAEARARDVQMLFADASTGANSPALVRQGQISELIAAKPANRRRILEEAAGVSGLHSRRHEAGLRLNAAEANLARLDDVAGEIEATLNRLRREGRKAEAYRRLSADIRALQGAVVLARWREAAEALAAAERAQTAAAADAASAARDLEAAETAARASAEALRPLREEEMVASAVRQRLELDRERLEREAALASAEVARLETDVARLAADQAREGEAATEAGDVLARTERELADLERLLAATPERTPALERALAAAGERRATTDSEVERLAAEAAAATAARAARRQAAEAALAQAQGLARAAEGRRAEAAARLARLDAALASAEREAAALAAPPTPEAEAAGAALTGAEAVLAEARAALASTERERAEAARAEAAARDAARQADDALRRRKAEAQGLVQLAASASAAGGGKSAYPLALDGVRADAALAQAVAAAFGDSLDAALDPRASAFWAASGDPETGIQPPVDSPWSVRASGSARASPLPPGAEPLADVVQTPPELRRRLSAVGLVARAEGPALRARLAPGQSLVSREGDLWRWDGYTVTAEAPRPAARRLAQRARLSELEGELAALEPAAAAAEAAHRAAVERLRAAEAALAQGRQVLEQADRAFAAAREAAERHARAASARAARADALAEAAARDRAERDAAAEALADAQAEHARAAEALAAVLAAAEAEAPAASGQDADAALTAARRRAAEAREAEARARAELDGERRARDGRERRREGLLRDRQDWTRRGETAARRLDALEDERIAAAQALLKAKSAPLALVDAQAVLAGEIAQAERRRTEAAATLAAGEVTAATAEQASRAAEQRSGTAREARAGAGARLEGARDRLADAAAQLRDASGGASPEALAAEVAQAAHAVPTDPAGAEAHLRALERDRDALGAVNLAAEEEAREQARRLGELQAERADLADAIATLRRSIETLNAEGRERVLAAFEIIAASFAALFETLFEGGQAELRLAESDDPLEAGLEIYACPPGKRLSVMSLMSGGEQALTATALIFAVFLANPAPVCVLDEVDAPLDDANVDRFCRLLDEMRKRTDTRFIAITHNPVTMSRMDRLFGVTMAEPGVSRLVSVDLTQAEALVGA
jgi:chromosome segregation protein